jgi:large subunit ribosomal protein L22
MATRQRQKAENYRINGDKRPTALAKYIRIPSDKVGIVLDLIRGKKYEIAVAILNNTNKSASPVILKVLNSAAANAENNLNIAKDNLFVAEAWAMNGPTLKRMMPRARGRADRILKRTCHIRLILDEVAGTHTVKAAPKATEKKVAAKVSKPATENKTEAPKAVKATAPKATTAKAAAAPKATTAKATSTAEKKPAAPKKATATDKKEEGTK